MPLVTNKNKFVLNLKKRLIKSLETKDLKKKDCYFDDNFNYFEKSVKLK